MSNTTTYYQTNLETDITYLKGVGPQRGNALKQYGINTIGNLLYHFPRTYLDRTTIKTIQETKSKFLANPNSNEFSNQFNSVFGKSFNEEELLQALSEDGKLIKRPVLKST